MLKRKVLITICIVFGIIIALFIGGYFALNTSFAKDRIRIFAESMAEKQLGREVSIGSIEGNIFREIFIKGVSIAKYNSLSEGNLVDINEISLSYSFSPLLRRKFIINDIQIIKPQIFLEMDKNGKLNLPEFPPSEGEKKKPIISLILGKADISSGSVSFDDKKDSAKLSINGLEGHVLNPALMEMAFAGEIKAENAELDFMKVKKTLSGIYAQFDMVDENIDLSSIRLEIGRSSVKMKGKVLAGKIPEIDLKAESKLVLSDFKDFSTQLRRLDGIASISLSASGKVPGLIGSCKISAPEVYANDLRVGKVNADIRLAQNIVKLYDMSAYAGGGKVAVTGLVNIANGMLNGYRFAADLSNLDIGSITRDFTGAKEQVSGVLNGDISVYGTEPKPGGFNANSRMELANVSLVADIKKPEKVAKIGAVKADLNIKKDDFDLGILTELANMAVKGNLSKDAIVNIGVKASGIDVEKITSVAGVSPSFIGKGIINAEASMKITDPAFRKIMGLDDISQTGDVIKGIGELRAKAKIDMPDLKIVSISPEKNQHHVPIGSLNGEVIVADKDVGINDLSLSLDESKVSLKATAKISDPPTVNAIVTLDSVKVDNYISLAGDNLPISGGMVNGRIGVKGKTTDINGKGEISITGLQAGKRGFDPVVIPIDIKSNIFSISELVLSSDGEKITTSCDFSPSGDYNIKVGSSDIDITRLYSEVASDAPIKPGGTIQMSLSGRGNIKSPSLGGKIGLHSLSYNGQSFGDGECVIGVNNQKANVKFHLFDQSIAATLDSGIETPFPFKAFLELNDLNVEPVFKMAGIGDKIDLRLTGNINAVGSGTDPLDIVLNGSLQNIIANLGKYNWINESPIKFDITERKFHLTQLEIKGDGGKICAKAKADLSNVRLEELAKKQDSKKLPDIDISAWIKVDDFDLSIASDFLDPSKPMDGKLSCSINVGGDLVSPSLDLQLDTSKVSYEQLDLDHISSSISYKKGLFQVEEFILNAFDGETVVSASVPIDLDIMNPPTPDMLLEKPVHISIESKGINLEKFQPLVPDIQKTEGKIERINFEVSGIAKKPIINGSVILKDSYIQLKDIPVAIEDINGDISIHNMYILTKDNVSVSSDKDYEASLKLSCKIDKGSYNANGSVRVPRSYLDSMIDIKKPQLISKNLISSIQNPDSSLQYPEISFGMEIKDGQIGQLVKEYLKANEQRTGKKLEIPVDGSFSGNIRISGPIYNPAGSVTINPLKIALDEYEIRNQEPISVSLSDRTLGISSLKLSTRGEKSESGLINMTGKVAPDKTFELYISGDNISPEIASFLLKSTEGQAKISPPTGNIAFNLRSRGNLNSPVIALSLSAKDIAMPVKMPNAESSMAVQSKEAKIDKFLLEASYNNDMAQLDEVSIRSFGNDMHVNGRLPVTLSLLPPKVEFPEQDMDMKLVMENFSLGFLSYFVEPIEEFTGSVGADIRLLGRLKDPRLDGYLRLSDANCRIVPVKLPDSNENEKTESRSKKQSLDVNNINLNVLLSGRAISMDNASFKVGDGYYKANGRIEMGEKLEPKAFEVLFETNPAKIGPFMNLIGGEIASQVSGNVKITGNLKGDLQNLLGKPVLDILRSISGSISVVPEGISVNVGGHTITNQKAISARLANGKLDVPSFRLVDVTSKTSEATSISAFGTWNIDGEKSFDATVYVDTGFISEFIRKPGAMRGRMGLKMEARGNEIDFFWPPREDTGKSQRIVVQNAVIDRFEGKVVYKNQNISLNQIWLAAGENKVSILGDIPLTDKPMSVQFEARLGDMSILSLLNKEIIESSGKGSIGAAITGNLRNFLSKQEPINFVGFCSFDNLNANFERAYIKFEDMNANIYFDSTKKPTITIDEFDSKLNNGELVLDTSQKPGVDILWDRDIGYKVGEFKDILITMRDCTFYQPRVYSITMDADQLRLRRNFDNPLLTGNINIKEGQYVESLQSLINNLFSTREIGAKASLDYPILKNLELDIDVQIPGNMKMTNEIVDAEAEATARVRGSLADPRVRANARIVEGKFSYFGREFTITKGDISNESKIDPKYEIVAETEMSNDGSTGIDTNLASNIKVQMEVKGSLNERIINLSAFSSGSAVQQKLDLNQSQIISLLTWGTSEALFSNAFSTTSPLLMEPTKWLVESQAEKLLRLKEFQIQLDSKNSRETRFVAAKQVMEQIAVTVDFGYSGQQWIGLQREVGKNFAIAGKVSQDGEWGLDLKLKRDFP